MSGLEICASTATTLCSGGESKLGLGELRRYYYPSRLQLNSDLESTAAKRLIQNL